jgi:hypothetical protein
LNEEQEKLGVFPYVLGGMSFIPAIGIVFGIITIIWGLVTEKTGGKRLSFIGGGGILFSIIIYSALFYFGNVQRGGVFDEARSKMSEGMITSLVQDIEFYKIQNDKYPESLEILMKSLPANSKVMVFDPIDVRMLRKPRYYYYELVDKDHYYLLGLGFDGKPFTKDDILPKVKIDSKSKIGLVIKRDN